MTKIKTIPQMIRDKYLESMKLGSDNQFSIVKIYPKDLSSLIRSKLYNFNHNQYSFLPDSGDNVFIPSDIYAEPSFIAETGRTIISKLLFRKEEEDGDTVFCVPLFILYYAFPEITEELAKWEDTGTDEGIIELMETDYLYKSIQLTDGIQEDEEDLYRVLDPCNAGFYPSLPSEFELRIPGKPNIQLTKVKNGISEVAKEIFDSKYLSEEPEGLSKVLKRTVYSNGASYFDFFSITDDVLDKINNKKVIDARLSTHSMVDRAVYSLVTVINSKRTVLGKSIESNRYDITSVIFIPKNVEVISDGALSQYDRLTNIVIEPNSNLKHISGRLLQSDYITKFIVPEKVETINNLGFYADCFSYIPLRKVIFSSNNSLKKIGPFSFYTSELMNLENRPAVLRNYIKSFYRKYTPLPSSLEEIGDFAFATGWNIFRYCIPFEDKLKRGLDKEHLKKLYFSKIGYEYRSCRTNPTYQNNYWCHSEIPDLSGCKNLKRIGVGAFRRCMLTRDTLIIPESVEVIEDYAFSLCIGIRKVEFKGDKIRYIGEKAFFGCKDLCSIIFNKPLKNIDRLRYMTFAFTNITSLNFAGLPNLKVMEACSILPLNYAEPKNIFSLKPLKTPKRVTQVNKIHVKEKYVLSEADKTHGSKSTLGAPTLEEYKLSCEGNGKSWNGPMAEGLSSFVEDDFILRYLQYLNTDKRLFNYEAKFKIPSEIHTGVYCRI